MKLKGTLAVVISAGMLIAGCATIKGSVFKQADGNYKATYSAKTERDALKIVQDDAKLTCKNDEKTEKIMVVDQKAENMNETATEKTDGFAAVAGSAVSIVGKMYGSENVRATLIFKCDKS